MDSDKKSLQWAHWRLWLFQVHSGTSLEGEQSEEQSETEGLRDRGSCTVVWGLQIPEPCLSALWGQRRCATGLRERMHSVQGVSHTWLCSSFNPMIGTLLIPDAVSNLIYPRSKVKHVKQLPDEMGSWWHIRTTAWKCLHERWTSQRPLDSNDQSAKWRQERLLIGSKEHQVL